MKSDDSNYSLINSFFKKNLIKKLRDWLMKNMAFQEGCNYTPLNFGDKGLRQK